MPTYVAWVADNARRFEGLELAVADKTEQALCASLVDRGRSTGLAKGGPSPGRRRTRADGTMVTTPIGAIGGGVEVSVGGTVGKGVVLGGIFQPTAMARRDAFEMPPRA